MELRGRFEHGMAYVSLQIDWMGGESAVAIDSTDGDFALIGMGLLRSARLVSVLRTPSTTVC